MPAKESAEVRAALKLLDTGKAKSISEAARLAGVNRSTIQRAQKRRAQPMLDLDGNPIKPHICALCGRDRWNHKAQTLHCPLGRKNERFPLFSQTQTYTEQTNNKGE